MLLIEMLLTENEGMELRVDSKYATDLAKQSVAHGRSKHIETRFHFLRDQVNKGKLEVMHCKTEEQVANLLTKSLMTSSFEYLKNKLEMTMISTKRIKEVNWKCNSFS